MMLLYCKVTKETGTDIAKELGIVSVNPFKNKPPHKNKVIRWGVGVGIGYTPDLVVNKMKAINNATNKKNSIDLFNNAGVRTAELVCNPTIIIPCVGRSFEHTQGQNFWLCWEPSQVHTAMQEGAQYFVEYIPIQQEYRVHVLGDKIAFVQQKYKQKRISTAFMGIQGFRNQWHHESLSPDILDSDTKKTAINAVKALGLDFGGVDILMSMKNDLAYVAEVNTGPALPNEEVREPYVNYFKKKLGL